MGSPDVPRQCKYSQTASAVAVMHGSYSGIQLQSQLSSSWHASWQCVACLLTQDKEGLRLVFEKTGYLDHYKAMSKC